MKLKRANGHYECEQIYGNMQFVSWGSGEEEVEDDPKPKVPRVSKKVKS